MPAEERADLQHSTLRKIRNRCVLPLLLAFVISYLDRVNVGFAALTANRDLGLTPTQYGWGAGLLFLGYCCFELPSNLALERFGARRWIARIMVTWGAIGCCMAWVTGPVGFYLMRFLLGAAEAGLFPGVILYLTYWLPARYRARSLGLFALGHPLIECDWRAALGRHSAELQWRARHQGLAVALSPGGRPGNSPRVGSLRVPRRSPR